MNLQPIVTHRPEYSFRLLLRKLWTDHTVEIVVTFYTPSEVHAKWLLQEQIDEYRRAAYEVYTVADYGGTVVQS